MLSLQQGMGIPQTILHIQQCGLPTRAAQYTQNKFIGMIYMDIDCKIILCRVSAALTIFTHAPMWKTPIIGAYVAQYDPAGRVNQEHFNP